MKTTKKEEIYVCDRCRKELVGWEDRFSSGEINIFHSSVIGDIFSKGAGETELGKQRRYFEKHKAVSFGEHSHQEFILKYGSGTDYQLCWSCNKDFVLCLGKFFKIANMTDIEELQDKLEKEKNN